MHLQCFQPDLNFLYVGETPYKCSYCEKRFSTRGQMVVHIRTHTGERPHVCHVCGKGFAQSSVLNTHMKLHTGRPEVCQLCQQRFCRPAELRLHMRKHTGKLKSRIIHKCSNNHWYYMLFRVDISSF